MVDKDNYILYVRKHKNLLINDIINNDVASENIYVVSLSTKYDEPYVECLADIPIGTLPYLLKEKSIFFAEKI